MHLVNVPFRGNLRKRIDKRLIILGIASFLWLIFRTGSKPSRILYPCQQAALANCLAIFPISTALLIRIVAKFHIFFSKRNKVLFLAAILSCSVLLAEPFWRHSNIVNALNPNQEIQIDLTNSTASLPSPSSIYAVNGRSIANANSLIKLMSNNGLDFYSLIQPNDVVLIKINEEWDERGGTDTDVLKQLIQAIIDRPTGFAGEIIVADNGQWRGSMNYTNNNSENPSQSTQDVVDTFPPSHKVSTFDWMSILNKRVNEYISGDMNNGYVVYPNADPVTGIYVSYPKFQTRFGTYISFKHGIWNGQTYENRLKVINLPVLKSHTMFGVTGAVKHYMGVQSESFFSPGLANGHESIASGGMGTLMAETRMPALNIICAIWVNAIPTNYEGAGPYTPYSVATRTNILAASADPVALDYWASKNILVQAAQLLGYSDTHTLNPDSTDSTGVTNTALGTWLPKSRDALLRAGIQVTTNEQQMNVCVIDQGTLPSPSPSPSPTPTATPTPTPTPTPNPTPTPSPTPTPTPTPTPSPTPTATPTPTPTPTPNPTPTPSPSPTPTATPTPTPTPTPALTPTSPSTPAPSLSPSLSPSPAPTLSANTMYHIAVIISIIVIIAIAIVLKRRR